MLKYHTLGARAWILEADGTTVCEVLTVRGAEPAASVAAGIVNRLNATEDLLASLKAVREKIEMIEGAL